MNKILVGIIIVLVAIIIGLGTLLLNPQMSLLSNTTSPSSPDPSQKILFENLTYKTKDYNSNGLSPVSHTFESAIKYDSPNEELSNIVKDPRILSVLENGEKEQSVLLLTLQADNSSTRIGGGDYYLKTRFENIFRIATINEKQNFIAPSFTKGDTSVKAQSYQKAYTVFLIPKDTHTAQINYGPLASPLARILLDFDDNTYQLTK